MIEGQFFEKFVPFRENEIYQKCFFKDINFWDIEIFNVSFFECYFVDCYFNRAKINDVKFVYTTFQQCIIDKSELSYCRFYSGAILASKISKTSLGKCEFQYTILQPEVVENVETFQTKFLFCPGYQSTVPDGKITVYKKLLNNIIVKLTIPETARRVGRAGEKCRADKAIVEDFYDLFGNKISMTCGYSYWDESFKYEKGKVIVPSGFDENRWNKCGEGIHFFLTFDEARNYEWN